MQPLFSSEEIYARPSVGGKFELVKKAITFGPEPDPVIGETKRERKARLKNLTWSLFIGKVASAAHARLGLLDGRSFDEVMICPWERLEPCTRSCRCQGSGVVTVGFLVGHYRRMLEDLGAIKREPKKRHRRGKPMSRYHYE